MVLSVAFYMLVIFSRVASTTATGFAKDESEDRIEFPPTIMRTFDSSVPVGHLRPLGELSSVLYTASVDRYSIVVRAPDSKSTGHGFSSHPWRCQIITLTHTRLC